jgi:formate transporter
MSDHIVGIDAYQPKEIAARLENAGMTKAGAGALQLFVLALLAGAFIAFGAMLFTVTITGSELGLGPTRLLGGLAFCLGLILVVVGGAELFTGNALIVMAWADGKVSLKALLRNWGIVFVGNAVGALGAAVMMHGSATLQIGGGAVGETATAIALGKLALDPVPAFLRGILCNALVCLAVWLCFAARSVSGKILAILFPITAFVAVGFEHSIANLYLIPIGMLHAGKWDTVGLIGNLVPVTLGNIVGGGVFVALVYYLVYLRPSRDE